MQISSETIAIVVIILSVIFLIAPLFLLIYVSLYNRRKQKHKEEKEQLQRNFEWEVLQAQMEVKEETLKTLGAELHDNIGQILSLTSITLSSVKVSDTHSVEKIAASVELTRRAIKEIRDLSQLLNGESLLKNGLVAAIDFELAYLTRLNQYIISFDKSHFNPSQTHNGKEVILFRLFQECISNVIRHAQATELAITLELTGSVLTLTVADNGIGLNKDENRRLQPGMGLGNIEKRVHMIQGNVTFESASVQGTTVTIRVPYP